MTTDLDSFISIDELVGLDSANTLVVTVNNRYARRIVSAFSGYLDARRGAMPVPDIVPFAAWLRQLGAESCFVSGETPPVHRLDAFGARHVWEQAIGRVETEHVLLDVPHAARHAMDADRLMSDWFLRVRPEEETNEYCRFRLWRQQYRGMLARLDAEDDNLEYDRICEAAAAGTLPFRFKTMVLAGFGLFSPRQRGLIESVGAQGIRVVQLRAQPLEPDCARHVAATDSDAEWRMAAQWAAGQLRRKPQGRFAIIAPNLEADAAFAHRVLRDALRAPGGEAPADAAGSLGPELTMDPARAAFLPVLPYNVAVARPLAQWFHARAALAWLRLLLSFSLRRQCTPDVAGAALLAGACAGDAAESSARAAIDVSWRRKCLVNVTQQEFSRQLSRGAPRLHVAWTAWLERGDDCSKDAPAGIWVTLFRQWLRCIGFPGQAALDSHAYQVLEALDDMLARLARQEPVLGPVSAGSALGLLERLALETLFQPQRDPSARLDVLGLLESEGGRWDGVWVLGLTDETLPAAPSPNPFVPLSVLRKAQAPRATPERELEWARAMYESLVASAAEVWLSHPRQEGERELRPSPFLETLPGVESAPVSRIPGDYRLEHLLDDKGPALEPGQKTRGGIGVIDTQARNPLWAFVKYRLGARALTDYAGIYDQNTRGLFLHRAVELVWRMLKDQESLQEARIDGRLGALIEQAVALAGDECLGNYGPALKALESGRAVEVLTAWLDMECARQPFAVADLEKECSWSFGALDLSLRVDRIDTLSDGSLAVIDYKSGIGSVDPRNDWMRARPVGLQLPFYAAMLARSADGVAALVLAKLHARKVETRGLAHVDCGLPGLAEVQDWPLFSGYSWEQLMEEWRRAIDSLAGEYVGGVARNASANQSDLDYCDVLPFLRLNEEPRHGQ